MEGIGGGGLAGAWGQVCPGAADRLGAEVGGQSNGDGGRQRKIATMCRVWPYLPQFDFGLLEV